MADVTAIILTKNEEKNIETCVRCLKRLARRIVVVDSGSTDGTTARARALGADVLSHPFYDYATQFNWALDHAGIDTRWAMRVDADEFYPPALCDELEALLKAHADDDVNGILAESDFWFLGKVIRHGGPKKRKITVFRYGHGRIEQRRMDEHTLVDGRVIRAQHRFEHHDFKDLNAWIDKMNGYATREMEDYFIDRDKYARGAREPEGIGDKYLERTRRKKFMLYYRFPKFLRCHLLFLYNYIFRLGFLDGREGFVYHYMYQRWYRTLVDAKILERELSLQSDVNTSAVQAESKEENP